MRMAVAEGVPRKFILPDAVAGMRLGWRRRPCLDCTAPAVRSGLLCVALGGTRAGRPCDWWLCPVALL
eukprot:3678773-Lingulodinium_polyedra.AAC.1